MGQSIFRVAVPSPLRRDLDYLLGVETDPANVVAGARVRVPFGRASRVGVVLEQVNEPAVDRERLREIEEVLDSAPCLPEDLLDLLRWASEYYRHPLGEVLATALPIPLRQGRALPDPVSWSWRATAEGLALPAALLARSPRQAAIMRHLAAHPAGLRVEELRQAFPGAPAVLRRLLAHGWVERVPWEPGPSASPEAPRPRLNAAQREALAAIASHRGRFGALLLEGVTSSGKTEVYLGAIEPVVEAGGQALVLVPEIGLAPQMVERFRARFGAGVVVLHSGLSAGERLSAWLAAREGRGRVVIGTRSAVFTPLRRPGILIVDEEHDLSYKQQEGFRYSARDLALVRAQRAGVPVVLGSATPSLESLHNARQGRYHHLHLAERAGGGRPPDLEVVDLRGRRMVAGLSPSLLAAMAETLGRGEQVLLFLNRRGFAPTLLCHECGWVASCEHCDAHLTVHRGSERLRCHHCGAERALDRRCPACGGTVLIPLGHGTERLETALQGPFPEARVLRIDRDTTRRKNAMQAAYEQIHADEVDILIGTQMLAKGHDFPAVTLAAVVDADGGLFSVDFRAAERMAQLLVQVAGRAGRGTRPGRVMVQTHHPRHPLLWALLQGGYPAFSRGALEERHAAHLPPFAHLALLRSEAPERDLALAFLKEARRLAEEPPPPGIALYGPVPAPMERRAGRYRAQLLVQSARRQDLQRLLREWVGAIEGLRSARRVRWSLDVDPQEMG